MTKNIGHMYVVMVDTDDDLIMRMITGFTDEEYRGYGDWSLVKYNDKAGNRIWRKS